MTTELTASGSARTLPGEVPSSKSIQIALPDDTNTGWSGLAWIIVMLIPVTVGGAILSPTINSAITKRVVPSEIGGMLGMSTAFVSAANALAPVIGGAVFQTLGSTAPFLGGGVLMVILWLIARRAIKPALSEQASVPVAEGVPVH
jgi:MFS family permease